MTRLADTDGHGTRHAGVIRRGLLALLGLLATAYLAMLAYLWCRQESLIFRPTPLPAEYQFKLPADVHETHIDVPGARLHALHMRLPHPDGIVFYLHGNAGNLSSWFASADFYRSLNVDLFMLDYRGYGRSTGHIESEAQLMADVRAAWQSIAPRYAGQPVVFIGRSLGTGLASQLAASLAPAQRPDLLVLVSPFISMQAMARQQYPYVPSALVRYPLRTDEALKTLGGRTPVLILHGDKDALIPYQHAQALFALTPNVRLQPVPGAGHGDVQTHGVYLDTLRQAIRATIGVQLRRRDQPA
ncbi:MAG: alpha/beta fold hydrolase [Aquabacterium sp.]